MSRGLGRSSTPALGKPLHRFVLVSSLGVYECGTTREPTRRNRCRTATSTATRNQRSRRNDSQQYHRKQQVPVTILRPGFVYGPRDRTVLPRLADRLKERSVIYIVRGLTCPQYHLVGNIADAVLLAIDSPTAVGEIFNITDGEFVSKRRFFETVADGLGLPRPRSFPPVPVWLARMLANGAKRSSAARIGRTRRASRRLS